MTEKHECENCGTVFVIYVDVAPESYEEIAVGTCPGCGEDV